jgi:hypothetical protein
MGTFVCTSNGARAGRIQCAYQEYDADIYPVTEPCPGGTWVPETSCAYRIPDCAAGPGECCPEPGKVVKAGGGLDGYCGHWDGSCSICICLSGTTQIATPFGPMLVPELRAGMLVMSQDAHGNTVVVPIARVSRTAVPDTHRIVHVVLADGRSVDVSAGHPDMFGRGVERLAAGDRYDGSTIVTAELVPYGGDATYDLLPATSTGVYWANGVPLGSTLLK